jgi:hypothetical protein
MASGVTDFAQKKIANTLMQGASLGAPSTWYLALFTVAPTAAGGGTEATWTSYARVALPNTSTYWTTAGGATTITVQNAGLIQFLSAGSGASATVLGWGLFDAATSGNMWFFGVTSSLSVTPGIIVQFGPNEITLTWVSTTP